MGTVRRRRKSKLDSTIKPVWNVMDNCKLLSKDYYEVLHAQVMMAQSSHIEQYTTTTFADHVSVNVEVQIRPNDLI